MIPLIFVVNLGAIGQSIVWFALVVSIAVLIYCVARIIQQERWLRSKEDLELLQWSNNNYSYVERLIVDRYSVQETMNMTDEEFLSFLREIREKRDE